jgi:hypothetical protein
MSDQEETILEPTEEIDENSEIEDQESIVDDLNLEMTDDDDMFEDEPYMMDMGGLLSSVLATEEGDTVCSALVNISRQMEIQNKILIKMLSQMQKN